MRTGHSEEMIELVKRDEVAVGLLRAFNDPDVEQFTLYEDELVLVVHPAHPSGDVVASPTSPTSSSFSSTARRATTS